MSAALETARRCLPSLEWSEKGPAVLPVLPPPAVPLGAIRRALRKAKRPVMLVNDASRVQLRCLPELLHELWQEAGEAPILIATGSHPAEPAQYRDRLGGLPVEVHRADVIEDHAPLGEARIDRRLLAADLIIAWGTVEPHYFGGWSGAHKTATVGFFDRASLTRNHRHALQLSSRPMALEGNPVFDDLAESLALLESERRLLAVNHVIDEEGRPLAVGLGTWRGSLERTLKTARAYYAKSLPQQVDLLIARVEGPLGASLYQADKGLKNNELLVRTGGDLILEAPMRKGVGQDRFLRLLEEAPTHEEAQAAAEEGYQLGDHKAVRWRALEARGVRIRVVSPHLEAEALAAAKVEVHPSLEAALEAVRQERSASAGQGLVVQDAGRVVCSLKTQEP